MNIIIDFNARSNCCYCHDGVCLLKLIDLCHCSLGNVAEISKRQKEKLSVLEQHTTVQLHETLSLLYICNFTVFYGLI